MPRKPNMTLDDARRAGYKAGWDARNQRSVQDDMQLWNWADWFVYTFVNVVVVLGALAIFALLTLWIGWASDHRGHQHCGFTSIGDQWCINDR